MDRAEGFEHGWAVVDRIRRGEGEAGDWERWGEGEGKCWTMTDMGTLGIRELIG